VKSAHLAKIESAFFKAPFTSTNSYCRNSLIACTPIHSEEVQVGGSWERNLVSKCGGDICVQAMLLLNL